MKILIKAAIIVFFGVVLYSVIYFYSSRSEGFHFVQKTLLSSELIENKIGKIKVIELPLFGAFKERHVNEKVMLYAKVRCVGEERTIVVDVRAEKNDSWELKEIRLNGEILREQRSPD